METTEPDWKWLSHLMYDTITKIVGCILDNDTPAALQLGAAIMNDYEEVVTNEHR